MSSREVKMHELESRHKNEKKDCFAWQPDHRCYALHVMDCAGCSFYKTREQYRREHGHFLEKK